MKEKTMNNEEKNKMATEEETKTLTKKSDHEEKTLSNEELDQVSGGGFGDILKLSNVQGNW
jgi:bacteriocin-like protein